MSLVTKREAIRLGRKRGLAAASWMFDGNTTDATYRAFLKGNEEGDPEVMDAYAAPEWLSGQWAGESINELLGECANKRDEDRLEEVMDAYCDAADTAYWQALERVARYHVRDARRKCECDNTHEQNDTVCQWCWANGRRKPADPEVE